MKRMLLALALLAPNAGAQTVTLEATLPAYNAPLVPDEDTAAPDDSVAVCGLGDRPLTDLGWHRLYYWPVGGPPRALREHDVRGMEGQPDTFQVTPGTMPGHYWDTALDTLRNESCPGAAVYLGPVTGAPLDAGSDPVVQSLLFDVRGRLVGAPASPTASGVYFRLDVRRSGAKRITREVRVK